MQSRVNLFTCPGGDTIQILKTKAEIEKIGISVDLSLELDPDLSKYDLVHLFNLTRVQETYYQLLNAKRQNKPVVLSTIYWPFEEMERKAYIGIRKLASKVLSVNSIESLKAFYKYFFQGEKNDATKYLIFHRYTDIQREILKLSDDCPTKR